MIHPVPTPSLETQLLTEQRAAWILNVSSRTLRDWREQGKLAHVKVGNNVVRYQASDVEQFILGHYRAAAHAQLVQAGPEDALWQRIERLIAAAVESRLGEMQKEEGRMQKFEEAAA